MNRERLRDALEITITGLLALGAVVGVRLAGLTAPISVRLLVLVVGGAQVVATTLSFFGPPKSTLGLHARMALQNASVAAVTYAIGWGPVLAIGFAFVAAQAVGLYGSRVVKVCAFWSVVAMIGGEIAVQLGAPSVLTVPYSHGIAGLMVIGLLFVMNLVYRAARDREEAADTMVTSELRLRRLLAYAADAILVLSSEGEITFASDAIEQLTGMRPEELVGKGPAHSLVNPEDLARIRGNDDGTFLTEAGRVFKGDMRLRFHDSERWCHVTAANRSDDPLIGGVLINAHDISDRKRAEELLAHEAATLEMIAKGEPLETVLTSIAEITEEHTGTRCVVRVLDCDRLRVIAAPSFDRTQRAAFEVTVRATPLAELGERAGGVATNLDEFLDRPVVAALHAAGARTFWTVPILLNTRERVGGTISVLLDGSAPCEEHEQLLRRFVSVAAVAMEQELAREELSYRAFHDDLTGLPNRALLRDRLENALQRSRRGGRPVAVLFMDLDRFKLVNDSLGHEAGDRLLVLVAERLRTELRSSDTIARFGGDEFVVVAEGVRGEEDAAAAVRRVTDALLEPFDLDGERIHVTASVGVSIARTVEEVDAVMREADDAMYVAKRRGRGTVHVHETTSHTDSIDRLARLNSLHDAVQRREFVVYYQPIVELATGRVAGAEALVRWAHPELGLLSPAQFVTLAEDSGLIVDIGAQVLEDAITRLREWPEIGIAVNVSARQLADDRFLPALEQMLIGVDAARLTMEVTESMLLEHGDATAAKLHRIDELGVRIALDDFGTGYSSLSSLARYPIGQLKVDRSFITDIIDRPAHGTLVRGVIELGHALGLEVVAEGIETVEQRDALIGLGCRFAQGYHFAVPAPPDVMAATLLATSTH